MNCPKCEYEMIWGGDYDLIDDDAKESTSSNLSCHKCGTMLVVYWGDKDD
jgi:DNA-directed RNA polymerase subunit M/transcription elongation factor TFIIS